MQFRVFVLDEQKYNSKILEAIKYFLRTYNLTEAHIKESTTDLASISVLLYLFIAQYVEAKLVVEGNVNGFLMYSHNACCPLHCTDELIYTFYQNSEAEIYKCDK